MKKLNWPTFSHLRLLLAPGIELLRKNTSEMVYFKKIKRLFFDHFLTKMHIFSINRHLKVVEGYLSKSCKKSSLYLLAVTNDSVFKSAPLHITAYFRRK